TALVPATADARCRHRARSRLAPRPLRSGPSQSGGRSGHRNGIVCLISNAEHGLLCGKSRECEFADRLKIASAMAGEFVRNQNPPGPFSCNVFGPRRPILHGTAAAKIHTVSPPHIVP